MTGTGKSNMGIAGTSGYYFFTTKGCCYCSPCTTIVRAWICYAKVVSKSCWIIDNGRGGAKGSRTWLECSSWCGESLIWLVEGSCAWVITIGLQALGSSWRCFLPFLTCQFIAVKLHFIRTRAVLKDLPSFSGRKEVLLLATLRWRSVRTVPRPGFLAENSPMIKLVKNEMWYNSQS